MRPIELDRWKGMCGWWHRFVYLPSEDRIAAQSCVGVGPWVEVVWPNEASDRLGCFIPLWQEAA